MDRFDSFFAWFAGHRTHFGGFCASLGAILIGSAQYFPSRRLEAAGAIVTLIGTHLAATGTFKSDDYHRDKLRVLKTKIDRRSGDSLIPARDLKRLLEDEKREDE